VIDINIPRPQNIGVRDWIGDFHRQTMDDEALDYGSGPVTPATPTPASESNDGTTDTARPSEKMPQVRKSFLPGTDMSIRES